MCFSLWIIVHNIFDLLSKRSCWVFFLLCGIFRWLVWKGICISIWSDETFFFLCETWYDMRAILWTKKTAWETAKRCCHGLDTFNTFLNWQIIHNKGSVLPNEKKFSVEIFHRRSLAHTHTHVKSDRFLWLRRTFDLDDSIYLIQRNLFHWLFRAQQAAAEYSMLVI